MHSSVRTVIVGGGVAAINAARAARRHDPAAQVVMFSEEHIAPYHRPPLSKEYLRGQLPAAELLYATEADLAAEGIALRLGSQVVELDRTRRLIQLASGRSEAFDRCVIATGAKPLRLGVPGEDLGGVHYLRTATDSDAIAESAQGARSAVIIGAGLIGLEVAASLNMMGLHTIIVEAGPSVWPRLADPVLSDFALGRLRAHNIEVHVGERVTQMIGRGRVDHVVTAAGRRLDADLVCVGIGAAPNVDLAAAADLQQANGIVVNKCMQTSDENIYAAGDCITFPDPQNEQLIRTEHWGHAQNSGLVAGANAVGIREIYRSLPYAWSDVFDLHLESTGHSDGADEMVTRGDVGEGRFTRLYLRQKRLTGYCAVNGDVSEFAAFRRLIRSGAPLDIDIARLAEPELEVRKLVSLI